MQMGIRVAEGAQVQLRAAPQLLDGAAGLSQILGKIRPLLIRALAQFLFVGLQSQRAAALVGLILEEIQHTGLHLPTYPTRTRLSGTDMAPATVQRYETSLKHTQDFVWETYHKKDILLDEVSRQFVEDYEFWLKTSKKCCHNTATKYLKNFKKIIRIALAKGWMKNDPFLEIRFSLDKVEPDFLEDSEIRKLISKEIDIPRLGQVRDIFVFCCFTGLAFSDIHGLGKEHIVEDSNGVRWIRKGRQKTKIMCNIPLMEIPLKILEKYSTNEYCRKHGVLFPVLCNQKMNAYLKELADICGIKKTLTTHVARHTFATFALANGVSIESVAKMLGHTNVQMTRHYARVLDRTVMREMSQIKMDFHFSM